MTPLEELNEQREQSQVHLGSAESREKKSIAQRNAKLASVSFHRNIAILNNATHYYTP